MYYVVLARVPMENEREMMIIYLYRNQKHQPSIVLHLNEYAKSFPSESSLRWIFISPHRILDHSTKSIKASYYLFELTGKDASDAEVFGAQDSSEREVCGGRESLA